MKRFVRRAYSNLSTDFGKAFLIAVGWQVWMLVLGIIITNVIPHIPGGYKPTGYYGLLDHTYRWDAVWFMNVIHGAYSTNVYSPSFYPLFPAVTIAVQHLFFGSISTLTAGFITNTLGTWMSLVALMKIAKKLLGNTPETWTVAVGLFIFSPAALFLHLFYSEAVFCAFGFWAYYFALQRRWALSALGLAFLTASRVTAILFVGLCILEFCRAYKWQIRRILNPRLLWFLLAPLGIISYGICLYIMRHDFLGMTHSYGLWSYHVFNLNFVSTYYHAVHIAVSGLLHHGGPYGNGDLLVNFILPVTALLILLVCSVGLIITVGDWGVPLGIFGLLSFIMFTLNSDVNSVHRYVLPCFGIYLFFAYLVKQHQHFFYPLWFITAASFGLQILLFVMFVNGYFAG